MTDNLIVLAAGMSSRMKKDVSSDILLTEREKNEANQRTKGLIAIDKEGQPLLDYILFNAKKAGIKNVFIVTAEENSLFKKNYGYKPRGNLYKGLLINYAIQHIPKHREKPLGTADAVYQALEQYPELKQSSFIVCNSDNLYSENAFKLLVSSDTTLNGLIAYDLEALQFTKGRIARFAILNLDEKGFLIDIIEKPTAHEMERYKDKQGKTRISMNIFKFDGALFFNYLKNCPLHADRNEKELPTALMNMIKDVPHSVIGISLSEHVPDLTSKEDIPILKEQIRDIDLSEW